MAPATTRGKAKPKAGIGDLFESMWEELFAYQTVKIVRTHDWRLAVMKRLFNAAIVLYMIFYLIFFHGWMEKEKPEVATVLSTIDGKRQEQIRKYVDNQLDWPDYCVNNTAFTYIENGENEVWTSAECSLGSIREEIVRSELDGIYIFTYLHHEDIVRNCTGFGGASRFIPQNDLPFCSTVRQRDYNTLVVAVEQIEILIASAYKTTWKEGTKLETIIYPADEGKKSSRRMEFAEGEFPKVTLQDLVSLSAKDISLDSYNELDDGTVYQGRPPTYRLTGMDIVLKFDYTNYWEGWPPTPFTLDEKLWIEVDHVSPHVWHRPEEIIEFLPRVSAQDMAQGVAPQPFNGTFYVIAPQGVRIAVKHDGSMGRFELGELVHVMVNIIVLFAVATTVVDVLAAHFINGFQEQKYEDDLETQIRRMLKSQLVDGPTRVEVEIYEQEELRKQKAAAEVALKALGKGKGLTRRQRKKLREKQKDDAANAELAIDVGDAAVPNIKSLSISGVVDGMKNYHGELYVATAELEHCKYVRWQWYISEDGHDYVAVEDETNYSFYASADEAGCKIKVEAVPIGALNNEGKPKHLSTTFLLTPPVSLAKIAELKDMYESGEKVRFPVQTDLDNQTVTLCLDPGRQEVSVHDDEGEQWIEPVSMSEPPVVLLMRDNFTAFVLTSPEGGANDISLMAQSKEDREVIALLIRCLGGDEDILRALTTLTDAEMEKYVKKARLLDRGAVAARSSLRSVSGNTG